MCYKHDAWAHASPEDLWKRHLDKHAGKASTCLGSDHGKSAPIGALCGAIKERFFFGIGAMVQNMGEVM